jgi:hypothetical protein
VWIHKRVLPNADLFGPPCPFISFGLAGAAPSSLLCRPNFNLSYVAIPATY